MMDISWARFVPFLFAAIGFIFLDFNHYIAAGGMFVLAALMFWSNA